MSNEGYPYLGEDYVGFLHRHPSSDSFAEMKFHVVVDLEHWKLARQMFNEENSNSAEKTQPEGETNTAMLQLLYDLHTYLGSTKVCTENDLRLQNKINAVLAQQQHS